jgi:hypothetical protein
LKLVGLGDLVVIENPDGQQDNQDQPKQHRHRFPIATDGFAGRGCDSFHGSGNSRFLVGVTTGLDFVSR